MHTTTSDNDATTAQTSERPAQATLETAARAAARELYAIEVHRQGMASVDPSTDEVYSGTDSPVGTSASYGWSPYLTGRLVEVQHRLTDAVNSDQRERAALEARVGELEAALEVAHRELRRAAAQREEAHATLAEAHAFALYPP